MAEDNKTQQGDKKVEAPKTLEEAVALLQKQGEQITELSGKLKDVTDESIKRKEKIRAFEQEKADKDAAALKEKGQFEELVKSLEPKAKRADELEKSLQGYFDLEVADVPEDKRSLIPAGNVETRLTWLKEAKSKGIFGEPAKKPENADHKKQGDPNTPEFLSWAPTDKRLETLSAEDYARWKKHNGRDGSNRSGSPSGWGGKG